MITCLLVLHLEPAPAVNDCWAQGAVPKVAAPPRKSLLPTNVDVLAAGDAVISAVSPQPVSPSPSVFTIVAF